jgi:hypothetical protein
MTDLPAWLQAFAAIVALVISVVAIWQSNAVERKRDRLRAHGIAVAIYPELLKLAETLKFTHQNFQQLKLRNSALVGQSIAAMVHTGTISIPFMFDRNVDNLYLLGEPAGPACLQLINVLLQYNDLVQDIASRVVMMNAQQWPEAVDHLDSHLDLISAVVDKCVAEVRPIHDSVKG